MNRVFACLVLLLSAACGETTPRTQVMLVLDAEPGVRAQTRDVQLVIRGGTGAMTQWQERLDRSFTLGDTVQWPLEVALVPLDGDATRVYEATATARSTSGDPVARVRAISGYQSGKTLMLRLVFEDACRTQVDTCNESQTCRAGECVDADVDVTSLSPYKPGVEIDASVDGAMDAPSDSGSDSSADASRDGSSEDANAGVDASVDAGADATVNPPRGQECERCDMRNSLIGPRGQTIGTCDNDLWCTASYRCFGYCECGYNPGTNMHDLCDNSSCGTDQHCVVNSGDGYVVADGLVPNHPSGNVAWTMYGVCTLQNNDSYSQAFDTCAAMIP